MSSTRTTPRTADGPADPLTLATWANGQRIRQPQADELLQAITCDAPAGLPATWWIDLSAQVSVAMVLATSRPPTPSGLPGALYFTDAA